MMFWVENLGALMTALALIVGGCTAGYKAHCRFEEWYQCRVGTASKKTSVLQRREIYVSFADLAQEAVTTRGSVL